MLLLLVSFRLYHLPPLSSSERILLFYLHTLHPRCILECRMVECLCPELQSRPQRRIVCFEHLHRSAQCNSVNSSVPVPTCEIFNPRKKPPHEYPPRKTHQRMAQKHASILAANTITTIFLENQSQ